VSDWSLRRAVICTAQRTVAAGLTHGTSGNVSARTPGGFCVTPTGVLYDVLQPADIVELDMQANVVRGTKRPSSEWRIHRDVYAARPEVGAVVHVHPPFATTIASLRHDLPAVHYMVAAAGGATIRCAAYATFGTEELSRAVLEALDGRLACLMANHGLVAMGTDLDAALKLAVETEKIAEVYWRALAAGKPVILDDEEMKRVAARFTDYGQA
jgi:L-fuculose-phosphate aldolase